jgi:hypothetical protein
VTRLLEAIRDELVTAGLVRRATVAGSLPPMWLSYRGGLPGPGEGEGVGVHASLVVGLRYAGGPGTDPFMGFVETRMVDVMYRASRAPDAEDLDRGISAVLDDRRGWIMGGLRVEESRRARALGEVETDELGYALVTTYSFMVRLASYAA